MKITQKAANLIDQANEITLASVSEQGYPRICVLSKSSSNGLGKIYCSTGFSGVKTRHFKANPKASICVWNQHDSVTLVGQVNVRTDRQIREQMWVDWYIDHFKGGIDDPDYCILEFTPEEATLWIDQEFITLTADQF